MAMNMSRVARLREDIDLADFCGHAVAVVIVELDCGHACYAPRAALRSMIFGRVLSCSFCSLGREP